MPKPSLTRQERRLASFCRVFASVYALGALWFALFPRLTFRLASLSRAPQGWTAQAMFWNVLAVAMMTAIATACALVAPHPRERRHILLPVVVAKLTSSALAAAHLLRFQGAGSLALAAVIVTDFPLFLVTLLVYRAAAPGVNGASAPQPAPAAQPAEPPKVQLGISKG